MGLLILGFTLFGGLGAFGAAGTYSKTVFYNDVSVGTWQAVSNVSATRSTGGSYTTGAYTNYWRVNGTNLQGRLPVSGVVTSSWVGSTNLSNSVVVSWSPRDGVMKYVVERSQDGTTWTNWQTVSALTTNFTDLGTATTNWNYTLFTNLYVEIGSPTVPWTPAGTLPVGAVVATNDGVPGQSLFFSEGTSSGISTGFWGTAAGAGDMLAAEYDAGGAKQVAFTNDPRIVNALTNVPDLQTVVNRSTGPVTNAPYLVQTNNTTYTSTVAKAASALQAESSTLQTVVNRGNSATNVGSLAGVTDVTAKGRLISGIGFALSDINPSSYGAAQIGYNEGGAQTIAADSYGAAQIGYNSGTRTMQHDNYGAMQCGLNEEGTMSLKDNSYGAMQCGFNRGTMTIETSSIGANQIAYNLGTMSIGANAYAAVQRGELATNATAVNNAIGAMQLLDLTNGQAATSTGAGSILLGAGTASNRYAIVAGDEQVSHGDGSITAGGGFYGSSSGMSGCPSGAVATNAVSPTFRTGITIDGHPVLTNSVSISVYEVVSTAGKKATIMATGEGITATVVGTAITLAIPVGVRPVSLRGNWPAEATGKITVGVGTNVWTFADVANIPACAATVYRTDGDPWVRLSNGAAQPYSSKTEIDIVGLSTVYANAYRLDFGP